MIDNLGFGGASLAHSLQPFFVIEGPAASSPSRELGRRGLLARSGA